MRLKYNRYMNFLLVIVFLDLKCFYLAGNTSISDNLALLLEVLFIAYVYFTVREGQTHYKYKWLILFSIVLVITSSLAAFYSYGQPIFLGIRAQRHWLVPMLLYFPLTKLLQSEKIRMSDLMRALDTIVMIYCIILIVQYLLGSSHLFLNIQTATRNGTLRLYADLSFVHIAYFIHLASFFNSETEWKKLAKDIFFIGTGLFIEVFVSQSRMGIFAVVAVSAFMFLKQKNSPRKAAVLIVAVITAAVFLSTGYGSSFANSILSGLRGEGFPATIRTEGRTFYMEELFEEPVTIVLGCGYANLSWEETYTAVRYDEEIYWNDNGIFGLMFYYGLLFVVWMVVVHCTLMRDAWKPLGSSMFFYLFCGLIGIYTLFPYCYVTNISFALVCAIIEKNASLGLGTGGVPAEENTKKEEAIEPYE